MPPGAVVAFCDSGAGYKCHDLLTYLMAVSSLQLLPYRVISELKLGDGAFPVAPRSFTVTTVCYIQSEAIHLLSERNALHR